MRVKGISWLGVGVDDFEEAVSFFENILGLEPVVVDERGVAILKVAEGQLVEVFGPRTSGHDLNSPPVIAFEVDDVDASREELRASGVELIGEIGQWNGFEWAYFRGPAGRMFAVKKTPPPGWERTAGD